MSDDTNGSRQIPDDDPNRELAHVKPDEDQSLTHIGLVGDTYTILFSGEDTAGCYTLIDMHVPPGGGPPPHRHDFEEMFHVMEGEIEVTFRDRTVTVRAGETANVPSNAPHSFTNASERDARLLCMCTPPGQEEFFRLVGVPVEGRTTPPPEPSEEEGAAMQKRAGELAPGYRTELL